EAGSQLRFGDCIGVVCVDHAALAHGPASGLNGPAPGLHGPAPGLNGPASGLHGPAPGLHGPAPGLIIQLGADPVNPGFAGVPTWVLAESWRDPQSTATVVLGDVATSIDQLVASIDTARAWTTPAASETKSELGNEVRPRFRDAWLAADKAAATAIDRAL